MVSSAGYTSQKQEELMQRGFTTLKSVLSDAEIKSLVSVSHEMVQRKPTIESAGIATHRSSSVWKFENFASGRIRIALDVLGQNAEFDTLLSRIFSDGQVKALLQALHGDLYKVTQVNIREVFSGDSGLSFHQDTPGETGMGIFLNDCRDNEGTTVFIPGSHKWPVSIRDLFVYPRIPVPLIPKKWVSGAHGKAGDVYFFINQAWHARPSLRKKSKSAAILISIFGSQSEYRIHEFSEPQLLAIPPVMRELVDHRVGLTKLSDGRVRVDQSTQKGGIMAEIVFKTVDYPGYWKASMLWFRFLRSISKFLKRR